MIHKFLLLSACLLGASAMGQDSTIALSRTPRAVLKFAPLSLLLDQDATVQAGLEYQVAPRRSVQVELGYGWKGLSLSEADIERYERAEVWRGRVETRFYTGRYRTNRRKNLAVRSDFPLGNYWAVEGFYKQINVVKRANVYSAEASSSTESYVLIGSRQVPISRYVLGAHLKIGRQFTVYDPDKRRFARTLFDIYAGAGVRWATNNVPTLPFNPYPTCGCGIGRSFEYKGGQWAPSLAAGLKVGFAL